jgi:hypothetical protein
MNEFSWSFNFLTHSDFVSVINVFDCLFVSQLEPYTTNEALQVKHF